MKIVLINPSQKILSDPIISEPIGLMYIESALIYAGFDVEMVDLSFDKHIPEDGDIYGFTSPTVLYPSVVESAKGINKPKIIGGPHASALPEMCALDFDAVVVGPGETSVLKAIDDILKGKTGGIYRDELPDDINMIQMPIRRIRERIKYHPLKNTSIFFGDDSVSAAIITSRGCVYDCSFCSSKCIWGRHVKQRSINNVLSEVDYLKSHFGIRSLSFMDDNFTLNRKYFKNISNELNRMNVFWRFHTRANQIDNEVLDVLESSGNTEVFIGLESCDDFVLDKINKKQKVLEVFNIVKNIKKRGLKFGFYIISGLPFEPPNIVDKTIDFIQTTNPDSVTIFTFVPLPGSDIWDNPSKYNIKSIDFDFSKYQTAVGDTEEERSRFHVVEYNDRSKEDLRYNRNRLKMFAMNWNNNKKISNDYTKR